MNIEKLENKVKELQKEVQGELEEKVKKLQKEIEKLKKEEKKPIKRWRAKEDDGYYILTDSGLKIRESEDNHCIDNFRYNIGNYFKTNQEAENYKEKLLIYQELKDLAMELNNGEKIDWCNNKIDKYSIRFDNYNNCLYEYYSTIYKEIGQIYCVNKNFLDIAIERIGEERLKKLFEEE